DALLRDLGPATGPPEPPQDVRLQADLIRRLKGLGPPTPAPDGRTPAEAPAPHPLPELAAFPAPPRPPGAAGRPGPYRLLKVVGSGGMGVVFEAEDPSLRRRVALKVMRPALLATASAPARFLREARAAAALQHDHVVAIHHVGEERGLPYLTM